MSAYPSKTRFNDTKSGQCMYFLPGQSGMHGFVCGAPTEKSYCDYHHNATHQKTKPYREGYEPRTRAAGDWLLTEREPDLTEILR
ncbi:hypothetical protein ACKWRH_26595 [Bradyrhizobium sp. Pa8]|uniref:hypothetical protein n=1 Tax=Bradyrhizobium sp. Pa8 TaxID=3386552 RepID=UPI00403F32BC